MDRDGLLLLRELHDIQEIQRVKAIYCWASDAAIHGPAVVGDALERILTEDLNADYGFGPIEGRAAFIDFMMNTVGVNSGGLWHAIHTPLIEVEGDKAKARWTLIARSRDKATGEVRPIHGRYEDEFRRTAEGWRIRRVRLMSEDPTQPMALR